MARGSSWPAIADEALVERLIPAVQKAIVQVAREDQTVASDGDIGLSAPDVANVLLMVLATVLEPSPSCATPMGIRLTAEAAGKELAELMRDARRLKLADAIEPSRVQ